MLISNFKQGIYIIMTTESNHENANKIGSLLLREKLIACVSYKNIESHFWWEGEINQSKEVQLIIKCREENLKEVCEKLLDNHSYEVPEIIYLPVSTNNDYLEWVYSL